MSLAAEYNEWHQRVFEAKPEDHDETSPWYKLVSEYLPPVSGKRVLEAACGRGGFSRLLAARGARMFGSDFSSVAPGGTSFVLTAPSTNSRSARGTIR